MMTMMMMMGIMVEMMMMMMMILVVVVMLMPPVLNFELRHLIGQGLPSMLPCSNTRWVTLMFQIIVLIIDNEIVLSI